MSTAILNGKLYAIGGHNGDHRMRSVEVYDFATEQWSEAADMNVARSDGAAAVLNGKIYIVGGLNEHQIERTAEFYVPDIDKWTPIANMASPRTSLAAVAHRGMLYAIGGNSGFERFAFSWIR